MAASIARTMLRSATTSARIAAGKVFTGTKSKSSRSTFRIPTEKPVSARIFRSPVEMSCISMGSMFPFHSATASAQLTSMLSEVSPWTYNWTQDS